MAVEPDAVATRLRRVYGFAISERLPREGRKAFDDILKLDPTHPQANYGLAMLAARDDSIEEALGYLQKALDTAPGLVEARRFRAVLLARKGRLPEAAQEINACLTQEPKSGPTMYAAACVASWAYEQGDAAAASTTLEQATQFLERAFAAGYGRDKIATDPDLAPLRNQPAFARWLEQQTK